ncbi:MAG: hypothetical protein KatS3mg119_2116 [Rhodothalassiaceae bacterium]|nr:MAG: hypothetical protein KatS3mg119_2116 [Rhodothalassiaceae bacterium]
MTRSAIEWTDATWNPVAGCTAVSPGCTNCYAARMAARLEAMGHSKYAGTTRRSGRKTVWTGRINLDPEALALPLRWRRPRRIFVNSMSDLFHEAVPDSFIRHVFAVMSAADWHQYQVLTKRPDRMRAWLAAAQFQPSDHIWLGTSVENADMLWRVDELRRTPAIVRFLSCEPLLGPLDGIDLTAIDWVIVGGESGPGARPMREEWVLTIRDACLSAGVAFFFKQWGGRNKKKTGRLLEGRIWEQYPAHLRPAA